MLLTVIKYFIPFSLGLFLGYFIFSQEQLSSESETLKLNKTAQVEKANLPSQVSTIEKLSIPSKATAQSQEKQQIIEQQQRTIEALRLALNQQQEPSPPSAEIKQITPDEILALDKMETISVKDFEERIKTQFMQRFEGLAVKLEGEQLEQIRENFERDSNRAEWSSSYENNINRFINDSDPNGLHYVDELSCNRNMCRLKVQSSESDSWQKLYRSMTQQNWHNSMTLTEDSGDPSTFIYYIPKPQVN